MLVIEVQTRSMSSMVSIASCCTLLKARNDLSARPCNFVVICSPQKVPLSGTAASRRLRSSLVLTVEAVASASRL